MALAQAADGVELDVHTTADGEIVVHHDADVGGRPIAGLESAVVRSMKLPNGEAIPTLAEALSVITPSAAAFVELKSLPAEADARLWACFDAAPRPDRCHVHAFDHRIIKRLTSQRPTPNAGVLSASYMLDPTDQVRTAGARALWQHADLVDRLLVARVHQARFQVLVWTVDRPGRMRELVAYGVDGICTNRPALAREVVG